MAREPDQSNPAEPPVSEADSDPLARQALLAACAAAGPGKSIDPALAARALGGDPTEVVQWRALLRRIKAAAAVLQDEGRLVVLRKGKPVDIRSAKGVLRFGLPAAGE